MKNSCRVGMPIASAAPLSYLRDRYLTAMRRLEPLADVEFELVAVDELQRKG